MDKVINNFADKIITGFVSNGHISEKQKSVYIYGLVVTIQSAVNITATLIIGLSFGLFFENLCFFAVYKILRKFAGGLHSSKFSICFLISISFNILLMLIIKYCKGYANFIPIFCVEIISFIILAIFSPIVNKNKPISNKEFAVYKSIVIVFALIMICFSLFLLNFSSVYIYSIGMAMLLCSAFSAAEKIRTVFSKPK